MLGRSLRLLALGGVGVVLAGCQTFWVTDDEFCAWSEADDAGEVRITDVPDAYCVDDSGSAPKNPCPKNGNHFYTSRRDNNNSRC